MTSCFLCRRQDASLPNKRRPILASALRFSPKSGRHRSALGGARCMTALISIAGLKTISPEGGPERSNPHGP